MLEVQTAVAAVVKGMIDRMLADYFGLPDLEFVFSDPANPTIELPRARMPTMTDTVGFFPQLDMLSPAPIEGHTYEVEIAFWDEDTIATYRDGLFIPRGFEHDKSRHFEPSCVRVIKEADWR
jgi:hypothetical protein